MNYLFNNNRFNEYLCEIQNYYPDCTTNVKPPETPQHTLPCWNTETKAWDSMIENYKDMTAYQKTNSRIKYVILFTGPIEDNYTIIAPPDQTNWYIYNEDTGWQRHIDPPAPKRTRCTKYQLIVCLTAYYPDLLTALRTAYRESEDLQFYWNSVLNLDRNNQDFKIAVQKLGISDQMLDQIFAKIEGQEPNAV